MSELETYIWPESIALPTKQQLQQFSYKIYDINTTERAFELPFDYDGT